MKLPTRLARRLIFLAVIIIGAQGTRAEAPFAPVSTTREAAPETAARLRVRWVELSPDPLLSFAKNPTLYSRDDVQALVAGLVLAKLATTDQPETVLRVTPSRSATVTYTDRKPAKGEPTDSVMITVGGVETAFTTRNTGVAVELSLIEPTPRGARILAQVKQTTFRGFKEYTGANPDGQPIPRGFYQPIFDTTTQEHALSLDADHSALIHVTWPKPDAPTLENLGVKSYPFENGPNSTPPQPLLLVVETIPAQ